MLPGIGRVFYDDVPGVRFLDVLDHDDRVGPGRQGITGVYEKGLPPDGQGPRCVRCGAVGFFGPDGNPVHGRPVVGRR